ncbi:MAG: hypothetical protein V3T72_05430 [Thermoanaerobaculia bacterium]
MFADRLQEVSDRIEGILAVSLVAKDGIPVESVAVDASIDLELLAAELMSQVRAVSQDHRELSVGKVRLFSLTTDKLILMVGALTDDYYLLLVLDADSNFGRARFELRRAILHFEEDLI